MSDELQIGFFFIPVTQKNFACSLLEYIKLNLKEGYKIHLNTLVP